MAITSTVTHGSVVNTASADTTLAVAITTTCLVLVFIAFDNNSSSSVDAATPISNSGAAMTWTTLGNTAPTADSDKCKVTAYAAYGNQNATVTFTHTKVGSSAIKRKMSVVVIEGAHATLATAIPTGNRKVQTSNVVNVSQSITPTGVGSAIFGVAADWNAANAYSALSGNTITVAHDAAAATWAYIVPTTNPLSSASAFTWGANCTGGANTWIAVEIVPAAPVGGKVKVYSGGSFVEKPVKYWSGSAWVEKPLKVYTGSAWVLA